MRDQVSPPNSQSQIDFAFIDENELTFDKLHLLLDNGTQKNIEPCRTQLTDDTVARPSDDMVNKTIETGENTRQLISLCEKMVQASVVVLDLTHQRDLKYSYEIRQCDAVHSNLIAMGEPKDSTKMADLLYFGLVTYQKKQIWQEYGSRVRDFKKSVEQVLSVANNLLRDQERLGAEVKGAKNTAKLTLTLKMLDNIWAAVRHAYSDMGTLRKKIDRLESDTGSMHVTIPNEQTGEEETMKKSLKEIALIKQSLVDSMAPHNVYLRLNSDDVGSSEDGQNKQKLQIWRTL